MNFSINVFPRFNCLQSTFYFIRKHFPIIFGLGLIAALGRVMQLEGFGPIASSTHVILEVIIEGARIALFLYVLGVANIKAGVFRLMRLFTQKANRKLRWTIALRNVKRHWLTILVNLVGFAIIAWVLNYLIDMVAYETCLYLNLKKDGILSATSSEWTILLFFKNLSVIPFTLVFETLFILWLTNKLGSYKSIKPLSLTN